MVVAVYGSASTPVVTTQPLVAAVTVTGLRSRRSMSLRVSQPLWFRSAQAGPNASRLYPAFGLRPFTGSTATMANADPTGAIAAELGDGEGLKDGVGGVLAAAVGVAADDRAGEAVLLDWAGARVQPMISTASPTPPTTLAAARFFNRSHGSAPRTSATTATITVRSPATTSRLAHPASAPPSSATPATPPRTHRTAWVRLPVA